MKYIYTDGRNTKAVDFGSPIRDSWDFVEAMEGGVESDLYARVASVNRAMNLTADATAALPFAVMKGGQDVDTSSEWVNAIGIMPKPKDLIRQWRLSLFMTNTAYARIDRTNAVKSRLFYVIPQTIRPIVKSGALSHFERWVDGVRVDEYKADDYKKFVYFFRQDHTTELLPSANTEYKALANSAGILYASDWWTRNYFERGAVKPTVLAVKGMVMGDKREEMQTAWGKFVRSLGTRFSELAKVINAETMDIKQIGDGLGDIKDSPVYKQSIENIAMASGIPLSLLLANSANYATAQMEYAAWYRDSITPWAYWMQEIMNDQIFEPRGYHFEFRPEQAEPSQEEEVQRAGAFQTYVNSGIPLHIAAQIVGIDLPAGMEYEDLKPDEPEEPEPVPPQLQPIEEVEEIEEEDDDDEMTMKAWDELDTWRKKAIRYAKRGKPVTFEFTVEHIPVEFADTIRKRLEYVGTPDEVRSAFEVKTSEVIEEVKEPSDELKALADAINKAVEVVTAPKESG
jgi:hypothetical protein